MRALEDGRHRVVIEPVKSGYTSTRYRYYFGHVLQVILLTCGDKFKVTDKDGNTRQAQDTGDIHTALKMKYNPEIINTPHGMFIVPGSTTEMSDSKFISLYEQDIIAEFSSSPYYCDFMDREEYREHIKSKYNGTATNFQPSGANASHG